MGRVKEEAGEGNRVEESRAREVGAREVGAREVGAREGEAKGRGGRNGGEGGLFLWAVSDKDSSL